MKNLGGRFQTEVRIQLHLSHKLSFPHHGWSLPRLGAGGGGRTLALWAIRAPSLFVRTLASLMHSRLTAGNTASGLFAVLVGPLEKGSCLLALG